MPGHERRTLPSRVNGGAFALAPVAAGVLLLAFRSERRVTRGIAAKVDARPNRDVLFGLAIGVAIAGYTLVDREGLDSADPLAAVDQR